MYLRVEDIQMWNYFAQSLDQPLAIHKAYLLSPNLKIYRLDEAADLQKLRTNERKVVAGGQLQQAVPPEKFDLAKNIQKFDKCSQSDYVLILVYSSLP